MPAPSPECTHPAAIIRRGFTILELSITLTIIALLMGGVLAGQTLIRASQLRAVVTQHQEFVNATNAFKEKYHYLPGDIPNATRFWGIAGGTTGNDATCRLVASTDASTCNGNGDGSIRAVTPGPEQTRYWQHLANAGLIAGQFTGTYDPPGSGALTASNTVSGKISSGLWLMFDFQTQSSGTRFFDGKYGHTFSFAGQTANNSPDTPIMTNQELWDMDVKTDDGMPATGKMVIYTTAGFSSCTSAANGASSTLTATYTANENKSCQLMLRQQF